MIKDQSLSELFGVKPGVLIHGQCGKPVSECTCFKEEDQEQIK